MDTANNNKKPQRLDKLVCVLNAAGDKGLTTKQLGDQLGIGEKSVPVYVTHGRKVLGDNYSIQKVVRGTGSCKHRYYTLVAK